MKIISYMFKGPNWHFHETNYRDINLIVGQSATGKTRILNTIFNVGSWINENRGISPGEWKIKFEHDGKNYYWEILIISEPTLPPTIVYEKLSIKNEKGSQNTLINRTADKFTFNRSKVPKLSTQKSAITLLKDEVIINPVFIALGKILKRDFSTDTLKKQAARIVIPKDIISLINSPSDFKLHAHALPVSARLFFLKKVDPESYERILEYFSEVFPFINEMGIEDFPFDIPDIKITGDLPFPGIAPGFYITEKNTDINIHYYELSSGMQKVLLLLTDMYTYTKGWVYLIDEYENSLGLNAIDFYPTFLIDEEPKIQLFITSHHPYIINNIPIENWFIFNRKGGDVNIINGKTLIKKYGKSHHQSFIKLINDPLYVDGVK